MTNPSTAPVPSPALFDITTVAPAGPDGTLVRVPLDELELAPNARREIAPEGIERLARMLMTMGQLVPCIGHRTVHDRARVILYAGQRRLLAARASHALAHDGLAPIASLIVLLLDHEPARRRGPPHPGPGEPARELTLTDQQAQFADCWSARAGLRDPDRIATVCADLGIGATKAHNLRRQLTLPEPIRARVAERPTGEQLSATLANRLADMHELAPAAHRRRRRSASPRPTCTTPRCATSARSCTARSSRTRRAYAVRIDDGALLDADAQLAHARAHLSPTGRRQAARLLGCEPDELDARLDALATRASRGAISCASTARCATAPAPAATPTCTSAAATSPPASGSSTRCSCSTSSASQLAEHDDEHARATTSLLRRRRARRRPTCARPPPRTATAAHEQRAAPRRGRAHQPRARPRPARRPDRPDRRAARGAAGDRLPPARPRTTAT